MKRRRWAHGEKALIVLSGLNGKEVAEIYSERGICQSQYYKWRDQFMTNASKVFESTDTNKKEQRLAQENQLLKRLVGELTLELKKARRGYEKRILSKSVSEK